MNVEAATTRGGEGNDFLQEHATEVVTIVFTDIVGSTALRQKLGDHAAVELLSLHDAILRRELARHAHAREIKTAGDSFFVVFPRPSDAVGWALRVQRNIRELAGPDESRVHIRIGIHVGEVIADQQRAEDRPADYFGIAVDTTARVMGLGRGDQILLTRFAFDNARQMLRGRESGDFEEISWMSHGRYWVDGIEEPLEIFEAGEAKHAALFPPADSLKGRRMLSGDDELVAGWRPALGESVPETDWEMKERLGEGGFGEVWLAEHTKLHQRRALKFCFRADRVRLLKREVTIFRLLEDRAHGHPNLVRVLDVRLDEPPFHLAMEYVAGRDLGVWAKRQGGLAEMPEEQRIELIAQAADGLHAAHLAGVLHRDIKPSNILIDTAPDGAPVARLADFGIGQVTSREVLSGKTQLGFTMTVLGAESTSGSGTQLYMDPELLAGEPASVATDVYSLGVVLYQVLIGDLRRPLTMDWSRRIADPLVQEDLARCFASEHDERFASAAEFAARLRTLPGRRRQREEEAQSARRAEIEALRRRNTRIVALALTVAALMGVLFLWAWDSNRKLETATERAMAQGRLAVKNRARMQGILTNLLGDLRERLELLGDLDVLENLAAQVSGYCEDLTRESDGGGIDDPKTLELASRAFVAEGDYRIYIGAMEPARESYGRALDFAQRLDAAGSANPRDAAFMQAVVRRKLARLEEYSGDMDRAWEEIEMARERIAAAVARPDPPADCVHLDGLIATESGIILASLSDGEPESYREARGEFKRAAELLQAPLEKDGKRKAAVAPAQARFEQVYPLRGLAEMALRLGAPAEAEAPLEAAEKLADELIAQRPQNSVWRFYRAQISLLEAELAKTLELPERARAATDHAVKILGELSSYERRNPWWKLALAVACEARAELQRGSDPDGARADFEQARLLARELAKEHPALRDWPEEEARLTKLLESLPAPPAPAEPQAAP